MRLKSRSFKKSKIQIVTSVKGEYIDGIYVQSEKIIKEILAIVQPYTGISLTQDRDLKVEKSSVIIFTDDEVIIGDSFDYQNKSYIIQRVDAFLNTNNKHYEAIAYDKFT